MGRLEDSDIRSKKKLNNNNTVTKVETSQFIPTLEEKHAQSLINVVTKTKTSFKCHKMIHNRKLYKKSMSETSDMKPSKIHSVKIAKINFDHSNLIAPHSRRSHENSTTHRSFKTSPCSENYFTTSNSEKSYKSSSQSLDYGSTSVKSGRNIRSTYNTARTPLSPIQSHGSTSTCHDELSFEKVPMTGRVNPKRLFKDENMEKKIIIGNSSENDSFSPSASRTNILDINASRHSSVEIDEIEKKSKQTKLELEHLKSELQKIINSNIKLTEFENELESQNRNIDDVSKENIMESHSVHSKLNTPNKRLLKKKPTQPTVETPKVEKIKHYDPKSAREFMRKQKLQRQNKLQEEIRFKIALQEEKRRKLKELQDKTMKILYNRNKQKPYKKKKNVSSNPKDEKCSDMAMKPTDDKQNDCLNISSKSSQKIDHTDVLETIRSSTKNEIALVTPNCHLITEPSVEDQNLAAIKIQSTYKGYKQRLRYKKILQKKRTNDVIKKHQQQSERIKVDEILAKSNSNVPSWLQPATVLPYPYNFITAVKQKLNLALYGYQYHKTHSSNTNLTSNRSITKEPSYSEYFDESVEEIDDTPKTGNAYPHGLDAESLQSEIKSMQSVVSELKLDLRGIHSSTNSEDYRKSGENSNMKSNCKKLSESKKLTVCTPVEKFSLPSPEGSPNSTGHDIESAILSASEHIPIQPTPLSNEQVISSFVEESSTLNDEPYKKIEVNSNPPTEYSFKALKTTSETSINSVDNHHLSSSLKPESSKRTSYTSTFVSAPNAIIQENSEDSSSQHLTAAQQLTRPKDKLCISTLMAQNISNVKTNIENKPQEINLKFEAEIKLLETFRESLKQIAADNAELLRQCIRNGQEVNRYTQTSFKKESDEKTKESKIETNNQIDDSSIKIVQTAQTENTSEHIPSIPLDENNTDSIETISFNNKNSTTDNTKSTKTTPNDKKLTKTNISKKFEEKLPFVNYKRGSGEISKDRHIEKKLKKINNSDHLQVLKISDNESIETDTKISNELELFGGKMKGFSLEMIDQQIRNEDIQLEHFKTLLKIREKALIDRTKGELAWLEITKKQLREKGNINQASTIKKKQRALILRLQQEKHEMQRLKLMHKASCEERKIMLKEQKNIIKKKLSTKDMLKQLKKSRTKEVKNTGPIKVYDIQQHSNESVITSYEDPTSQHSYSVSEEFSIRSRSVVNSQSEIQSEVESIDYRKSITVRSSKSSSTEPEKLKISLLKKEEELKRRREKVEELLQWHQRLTEEEKQVAALEEEARKLTLRNDADDIIYSFSGIYLNTIWFNITQNKDKKYEDTKRYFLSKTDVDNFYEDAKKEVLKKMNQLKNVRSLSLIASSLDNSMVATSKETSQKDPTKSDKLSSENISEVLPKSVEEDIPKDAPESELEQSGDSTLKIDGESITLKSEIKSPENDSPEKYVEDYEITDVHNKAIEEITSELDDTPPEILNEAVSQSQVDDVFSESKIEEITSESHKDLSETDFNKSHDSITSKKSLSEQFLIREEMNERNFHKLSNSFTDNKKDEPPSLSSESKPNISENILSQLSLQFDKKDEPVSPSEHLDLEKTENNLSKKSPEETSFENLSIKTLDVAKSDSEHLLMSAKINSELEEIRDNDNSEKVESILEENSLENIDLSKVTLEEELQNGSNSSIIALENEFSNKSITHVTNGLEKNDFADVEIENGNISHSASENSHIEDNLSNKSINSVSENEIERIDFSNNSEKVSEECENGNISSSPLENSYMESDNSNNVLEIENKENLSTSFKTPENILEETQLDISKSNEINIDENVSINSNKSHESLKSVHSENNSEKQYDLSRQSTESTKNNTNDAFVESIIGNDEHSTDNILKSIVQSELDDKSKDSSIVSDIIQHHDEISSIGSPDDDISDVLNHENSKRLNSKDLSIVSQIQHDRKSSIDSLNDLSDELSSENHENLSDDISKHVSPPELSNIQYQNKKSSIGSPSDLSDELSYENTSDKIVSDIQNDEEKQFDEILNTNNSIHEDDTLIPTDLNDTYIKSHDDNNYSQDDETYTTSNQYSKDSISSSDFNLISATDLKLKFEESKDFEFKNDTTLLENISMPQVDITSNSVCDDDHVEEDVESLQQSVDKDEIEEEISINETTDSDRSNVMDVEMEQTLISDCGKTSTNQLIVNEAEELLRKQLEIELEIKELEKQQQSEIVPYVYVREIPNKPPPPYKPPTLPKIDKYTIPSTSDQLTNILIKTSDILYTAYTKNSLNTIETSAVFENGENEIENNYNRFIFDLCKEITFNYFNLNATDENVPSWMKPTDKTLYSQKQNKTELEKTIISKVNEYLGFSITPRKDNLLICWSRKKRDHVDELLVKESQAEESGWTNFESDEVAVKNELTSDIFDLLLNDTISVIRKINAKKIKKY